VTNDILHDDNFILWLHYVEGTGEKECTEMPRLIILLSGCWVDDRNRKTFDGYPLEQKNQIDLGPQPINPIRR
jgi:hypothetical protein